MNAATGKWLIITGLLLAVPGLVICFFHDKLHWPGRLPGDIRIEKENTHFYFPVTTIFVVSELFTVVINIIKRFFL